MDKETQEHILNILRRGTITWSGRSECLRRARKNVLVGTYKNGKPKYKFHWQCGKCREWYLEESMLEVDHIKEVGPFTGNLDVYAKRLYCGQDNLQALCVVCHAKKTSGYNASLRYERKEAQDSDI